jgi:hypothetical protein
VLLNRPEEVSGLLVEAQTKAIQLKQDAEEIHSFVQSNRAWETHAAKLDEINEHINDLLSLLSKLAENSSRTYPE